MSGHGASRLGFAALTLVGAAVGACRRTPDPQRIVLTGSSTVAPLAAEIARQFEGRHPGVKVEVQTGGSSRGITDARAGLAHIGMVSRALRSDERDLHAFPIARDGIGIIAHADNRVEGLRRQQVVDIFKGRITNWRDVGGRDAPITVVNKAEGRSTLELFLQYFELRGSEIRAQVIIGDNEQGIKTVASNPDAIGYVSIGAAEHDRAAGVPVRLLSLDGIAASSLAVRKGTFPLSRPLHLVTRHPPTGLVERFISFARSQEVHALIVAQALVPER